VSKLSVNYGASCS